MAHKHTTADECAVPYKHTASFAKRHRRLHRNASLFYPLREALFSIDIYGYTPSLIAAEFKTLVSLLTTIFVFGAFLVAVVYTTFNWATALQSQSESTMLHDQSVTLVPSSISKGAAFSQLGLPPFAVAVMLGDSSFVDFAAQSDAFKLTFQQATICNGDNVHKREDNLPYQPCNTLYPPAAVLQTLGDSRGLPSVANCAAWDAATAQLDQMNNTAVNLCGVPGYALGQQLPVPRVVGTFYNYEYSYITATFSVRSDLLNDSNFSASLFKGNVQVFLPYNYTSPTNLHDGVTQTNQNIMWSNRINIVPSFTVKTEIGVGVRKVKADNYWWNLKALADNILDCKPSTATVVTYVASVSNIEDGWSDISKVYLRFNDEDTKVEFIPPGDLIALLSGWGGFLALLMKVGAPAVIINQWLFTRKVKKLITQNRIVFDEELRKKRQLALHVSAVKSLTAVDEPAAQTPGFFTSLFRGMSKSPAPATELTSNNASAVAEGVEEKQVACVAGCSHGAAQKLPTTGPRAVAEGLEEEARAPGGSATALKYRKGLRAIPEGPGGMEESGSAASARPVAESVEVEMRVSGPGGKEASMMESHAEMACSMAVHYEGDIFVDEDVEENYVDVLRHATSECNALFHLRQTVRLVQEHSPVMTLWADQLARSANKFEALVAPPALNGATDSAALVLNMK